MKNVVKLAFFALALATVAVACNPKTEEAPAAETTVAPDTTAAPAAETATPDSGAAAQPAEGEQK